MGNIGVLHLVKITFLGESCLHKGLNQQTVQSLRDLVQLRVCVNFMRISLMLLLNGGVGSMDLTMTLGMEGQKHVFANLSILNHAAEVYTAELYHIFQEEYKKGTTLPNKRFKRPIHIWSIECGETMLMNFLMLSTLIGQLKRHLAHAINLKR